LLRIRETDSWPLDNIDVGGTVDSDRVSELDRCALYCSTGFKGCLCLCSWLALLYCIYDTVKSNVEQVGNANKLGISFHAFHLSQGYLGGVDNADFLVVVPDNS
jgi:hypothetical protein